MRFLFPICRVLPKIPLIKILIEIAGFSINVKMKIGANFCHVIRIILASILSFGTTSRNHLWNGAAASFIRMAVVPDKNRTLAPLI